MREFAFNTFAAGADERTVAFDEAAIARHGLRTISPRVMDLIEIVAALHMADRMVKRPSAAKAGSAWSRNIRVHIGVRERAWWSRPEILEELQSILLWLTDDRWELVFVARQAPVRAAESVQFLFDQPPEGDVVSLFSGGMDSVAGMLVDLENGAQPIAVSVDSNGRMRGTQRAVLDHLGDSVGAPVASVPVKLHLRGVAANEQSQRMRGLAFLSIAAATAATLGVPVVHVYENGIGAVNLPYTAAQSGAHGTHSMHPITLVRIERLMRAALEFEFSLTNVSLFQTKAEMCQRVPPRHWAVLQRSESCDTAFAARVSGPRACGHCTSCVLRRQALHGAHLSHLDDPADYRVDVTDPRWFNHPVTYSLRAMASQVVDLVDAMRSDCAARALGARFPDLAIWVGSTSPSDRPALSAAATRLFETYANEWRLFPSEQVSRMCGNTITGAPIALTGHEHTYEDRSR